LGTKNPKVHGLRDCKVFKIEWPKGKRKREKLFFKVQRREKPERF